MTSPITTKACEAWFLLEAADLRGLPAPYDVAVTDHSVTKLGLRTVDELNTWAEAIGSEVTSRAVEDRTHWHAEGELHEMSVVLFVVTRAAAEVTP